MGFNIKQQFEARDLIMSRIIENEFDSTIYVVTANTGGVHIQSERNVKLANWFIYTLDAQIGDDSCHNYLNLKFTFKGTKFNVSFETREKP